MLMAVRMVPARIELQPEAIRDLIPGDGNKPESTAGRS
jgi:hypothetical protein